MTALLFLAALAALAFIVLVAAAAGVTAAICGAAALAWRFGAYINRRI